MDGASPLCYRSPESGDEAGAALDKNIGRGRETPSAMDASATTTGRQPYGVIALIGVAHAVSHFYHLAVPVVFPLMKDSLGVSYAQLGLLATLFYVASGICQFIAGFLVDHYGARRILFLGMGIVSGAVLLCGFAPSYGYFLILMPLAGIGNSVFHPADFGILNASVKESWLGRAYGVHTLGGNIGWALAPLVVLGLAASIGWRSALVVAGLIGFAVLGLLLTQASQLDDGVADRRERRKTHPPIELRAILLAPAIVLCFVYFMLLAIFQVGIQNFLPTILIVDGFTPVARHQRADGVPVRRLGRHHPRRDPRRPHAPSRLDRRVRPVRGRRCGGRGFLCRHRRADRRRSSRCRASQSG